MRTQFVMAALLVPAVFGSTHGDQTFEFLGKSGSVIWAAEDIGGEYSQSVLHQIVIEPNGVAAGSSELKEYGHWQPVRDLVNRLELEPAVELEKHADGTLGAAAAGLRIATPLPDAALMERFYEHIRSGGSNARTWATAAGGPHIQPPRIGNRPAEILYGLPAGLYVNYSLDRGWYFPRSGLILILTRQPVRAVGMDAMHGLLVLRVPLQHKED